MRRLLLASAVLVALLASTLAVHRASAGNRTKRAAALAYLGGELRHYQRLTWYWQRLMGVRETHSSGRVLAVMAVSDVQQAVTLWRTRALVAHRRAQHPPHRRDWLCIHHYEAAWNDAGAPYWGGLQMSLWFQQRYGWRLYRTKGTADHWSPLEQIWTAERAVHTSGFWPWPNTARICGLI